MDPHDDQISGRRRLLLGLAVFGLAPLVSARWGRAQTPAEQASRRLNRLMEEDRLTDRAEDAATQDRGGPAGAALPRVQQLDDQRRSLQPDLPRANQAVPLTGGERGATGGGQNPQR